MAEPWPILDIARYLIEWPLLLYAAYRGSQEGREILADKIGGLKPHSKYWVKSTHINDIIRDDQTERVKLRKLRVYHDTSTLAIDPVPLVIEPRGPVKMSKLYSIPGWAACPPGEHINITFPPDEELKPFRDHTVLLGYTMNETLDALYEPPGILAKRPVGKELLVYEAHFPPSRHYERAKGVDKPEIDVYTTDTTKDKKNSIDPRKYEVTGGNFDYSDGLGKVDWFRVTVPNPPQHADINIDWKWRQ